MKKTNLYFLRQPAPILHNTAAGCIDAEIGRCSAESTALLARARKLKEEHGKFLAGIRAINRALERITA